MRNSEASAVRNYAKASVYRRLGMPEHAHMYERRARAHTRAMHFGNGNDVLEWTVENWSDQSEENLINQIFELLTRDQTNQVLQAVQIAVYAYGSKKYSLQRLVDQFPELMSCSRLTCSASAIRDILSIHYPGVYMSAT